MRQSTTKINRRLTIRHGRICVGRLLLEGERSLQWAEVERDGHNRFTSIRKVTGATHQETSGAWVTKTESKKLSLRLGHTRKHQKDFSDD
jgi:hypothetical protein